MCCGEWGLLFTVVHRLPIVVASLVAEHELSGTSCGPQTWLLCGMWDLPGPGITQMFPALAGRLFTTEPPGKLHLSS